MVSCCDMRLKARGLPEAACRADERGLGRHMQLLQAFMTFKRSKVQSMSDLGRVRVNFGRHGVWSFG